MQFNVAQLLKEPTGATRRYPLNETLNGLDEELKFLGPLVGTVQLLRTNSGILATGELSTVVRATCNRCLEPIAVPVRFTLEESFRPLTEVFTGRYLRPDEFEGTEEELEDAALLINEQHILNVTEVVRQLIWTALPIVAACNWSGAGQCPNLTRRLAEIGDLEDIELYSDADERHQETKIDPRWAALLNLRSDEDSASS